MTSVVWLTESTLPVPIECSASRASLTAVFRFEAVAEMVSVRSPPPTVGRKSVKSSPCGTLTTCSSFCRLLGSELPWVVVLAWTRLPSASGFFRLTVRARLTRRSSSPVSTAPPGSAPLPSAVMARKLKCADAVAFGTITSKRPVRSTLSRKNLLARFWCFSPTPGRNPSSVMAPFRTGVSVSPVSMYLGTSIDMAFTVPGLPCSVSALPLPLHSSGDPAVTSGLMRQTLTSPALKPYATSARSMASCSANAMLLGFLKGSSPSGSPVLSSSEPSIWWSRVTGTSCSEPDSVTWRISSTLSVVTGVPGLVGSLV